ncbi:MAG: thermonuclease family protein [Gemmatimonadota bacterium]|jgi:micrococcal nuclease|nr:thermonuclease family protein [Gemmatimonadota bacterium]
MIALVAVLLSGCEVPARWAEDTPELPGLADLLQEAADSLPGIPRSSGQSGGSGAPASIPDNPRPDAARNIPASVSGIPAGARFVASSRGSVYYWVGCDSWRSLSAGNRRWFQNATEAEAAGFQPSTARGCQDPDLAAAATPVETGFCTVTRIVDGDTLTCAEGAARIRLLLVDTPELAQGPTGSSARLALEQILPPGTPARVELDRDPYDRYGRILAYLYTPDDRMVNEELARSGYAVVLLIAPNNRYERRMITAVEEARTAGRGLWATGGFTCEPALFRAGECRP